MDSREGEEEGGRRGEKVPPSSLWVVRGILPATMERFCVSTRRRNLSLPTNRRYRKYRIYRISMIYRI